MNTLEVEKESPTEMPPDKPNGEELSNPRDQWHEETDAAGQRWRVYGDGRRLKIGGTIGPGAPKKEVREQYLANAIVAAKRDAKLLLNEKLPDDDPAVERAKERGAKYGLGTQDEVLKMDSDRFIKAHAVACAKAGMDVESTLKLTDLLNEELGIKD